MITLTIYDEPASKANSRKLTINPRTRKPQFIKSAKARAYEVALKTQVRKLPTLMSGELVVEISIYYASERPDLDESVILDGLQGLIYENDRQVREKHVYHYIDRKNPRSIVTVRARI